MLGTFLDMKTAIHNKNHILGGPPSQDSSGLNEGLGWDPLTILAVTIASSAGGQPKSYQV